MDLMNVDRDRSHHPNPGRWCVSQPFGHHISSLVVPPFRTEVLKLVLHKDGIVAK